MDHVHLVVWTGLTFCCEMTTGPAVDSLSRAFDQEQLSFIFFSLYNSCPSCFVYLGGQAKTLMFVHMSPEVDAIGETISTLKFAERVATVELGAARANKETGDVRELKEQVFIRSL